MVSQALISGLVLGVEGERYCFAAAKLPKQCLGDEAAGFCDEPPFGFGDDRSLEPNANQICESWV
jgi:hypothetical protein